MTTGIILLAAGRSTRFGSDKRCSPWPGQTCMLKASISKALASGLPCYVVLHPGDQHLLDHCIGDTATAGVCPDAAQGIGNSIAFGVHANQDWSGWIIARADMPGVTPETYRRLADHLERHDCGRPVNKHGQAGYPTAFRKEHACELMRLHGHRTEARLIPDEPYVNVIVFDAMIHADINRPEDMLKLR
ncbi:MAG: nucleotidyltransferase family protein [Pseudomonadota bacterium]|nr:nucleotidyltransferase family protein [Pseudomonadota bacterium]MEC8104027.1 nucleotidyltransferase family protein [Pseudomonadota bacterium]